MDTGDRTEPSVGVQETIAGGNDKGGVAEDRHLLSAIRERFPSLSEGQRRLARHVLRHPEDWALLPAARIADAVGLSESAVVRFAAKLGYRGYPAMQLEAQRIIRMRLAPVERLSSPEAQKREGVFPSLFGRALDNLRSTASGLSQQEVSDAARALFSARTVYVVGLRSSVSMANHLGFLLKHVHPSVATLVHGGAELFENLRAISEEDGAVCVSFPRYTNDTLAALQFAVQRGAKAIAITDTAASVFAQSADIALTCDIVSDSFFESLVSCAFLIEVLVSEFVKLDKDRAMTSMNALEDVLSPHKLWVV